MAPRQSDIERSLRTKFHFQDSLGKGHDHICIERNLPNGSFVWTKFSRGTREVPKALQAAIARQIGVRRDDLMRMVGCTMSEQQYLAIAEPPQY